MEMSVEQLKRCVDVAAFDMDLDERFKQQMDVAEILGPAAVYFMHKTTQLDRRHFFQTRDSSGTRYAAYIAPWTTFKREQRSPLLDRPRDPGATRICITESRSHATSLTCHDFRVNPSTGMVLWNRDTLQKGTNTVTGQTVWVPSFPRVPLIGRHNHNAEPAAVVSVQMSRSYERQKEYVAQAPDIEAARELSGRLALFDENTAVEIETITFTTLRRNPQ